MKRILRWTLAGLSLAALSAAQAPSVRAATGTDPDWPCVQRKVPHLSAGMVWAGPPVDEKDRSWKKDEALSSLVEKLALRRTSMEEAKSLIDAYAERRSDDKKRHLTLLFTGLLQTINKERDAIMRGISRYARQQAARADGIKETRDKLVALAAKETLSDEEKAKRDQLEERLNWDTRIYDERSQSLTYVCESPRILEQRLFELARAIQQHLD
jgi:hypothetical protein